MSEKETLPMACPLCGKRACDTYGLPDTPVTISIICPHCRSAISLPLVEANVLKRSIDKKGQGGFRRKRNRANIVYARKENRLIGNIPSKGSDPM